MPAWTITLHGRGSRVLRDEQRTCTQHLVHTKGDPCRHENEEAAAAILDRAEVIADTKHKLVVEEAGGHGVRKIEYWY